jgi:hypothetical protein
MHVQALACTWISSHGSPKILHKQIEMHRQLSITHAIGGHTLTAKTINYIDFHVALVSLHGPLLQWHEPSANFLGGEYLLPLLRSPRVARAGTRVKVRTLLKS